MADTQEQNLAVAASLASTDYVRAVVTPGAVPESKNVTLANLQASFRELLALTSLMVPSLQVRTSATFTKNTSTVLANIPGLSVNLVAGKNYRFTVRLHTTSNASGGVKAAMSGTAGVALVIYDILWAGAAATNQVRATALGTSYGHTAGTTDYFEITGYIACNANGTLTVQFAQNASHASDSIVQIGSSLFVEEVT